MITHERTILLTQECLDYLKSLDALDSYVNIPPVIDENIYGIICKHRRLKIESDLRVRIFHRNLCLGRYKIIL